MSRIGIFLDIVPLLVMVLLWLSGHLNFIRAVGSVFAVGFAGVLLLLYGLIAATNLDANHSIAAWGFGTLLLLFAPWLGLAFGYAASTPVAVSAAEKAHRHYQALPPKQKAKLHRGLLKLATATVKVVGPHVAAHLRKKERHTLAGIVEDGSKML